MIIMMKHWKKTDEKRNEKKMEKTDEKTKRITKEDRRNGEDKQNRWVGGK